MLSASLPTIVARSTKSTSERTADRFSSFSMSRSSTRPVENLCSGLSTKVNPSVLCSTSCSCLLLIYLLSSLGFSTPDIDTVAPPVVVGVPFYPDVQQHGKNNEGPRDVSLCPRWRKVHLIRDQEQHHKPCTQKQAVDDKGCPPVLHILFQYQLLLPREAIHLFRFHFFSDGCSECPYGGKPKKSAPQNLLPQHYSHPLCRLLLARPLSTLERASTMRLRLRISSSLGS